MREKWIQFLSCFILKKKKRRAFRLSHLGYARKVVGDNEVRVCAEDRTRVHLHIEGSHNHIEIGKLKASGGTIFIHLAGNNCRIVIEDGFAVSSRLQITMGQSHRNFGLIEDSSLRIGRNTSVEEAQIVTYHSHVNISIGERCMFSTGVTLFHTDAHPIMDWESKAIINRVRDMVIGNHVWLGAGATVMKNTHIPDESIVGYNSVVGASYARSSSAGGDSPAPGGWIIAGNPAKLVKIGITWDANGSAGYVQNESC